MTNIKNYSNFLNRLQNFNKVNIKNIVTLGRAIFGRDNKLDIIPKISCPLYFIVGNEDEPRPPKESLEMSKLTEPLTTDALRVLESRGS